eukprot:TRINITY_DN47832_c0_g1_i1.p1 TRINITY_DN47832_c0_g1~~TRINITY_DN47832_c0_g1_i1.p1  ORF type:complete len:329 (+),score=130.27 TRINITY_DN47832_c0_g1_i1:62-988(+)
MAEEGDAAPDTTKHIVEAATVCFTKIAEFDKAVHAGPDGLYSDDAATEEALRDMASQLTTLVGPERGAQGYDPLWLKTALDTFADAGGLHLCGELLEAAPPSYIDEPDAAKFAERHAVAVAALRVLAMYPRAYANNPRWALQLEGKAVGGLSPPCFAVRRVVTLLERSSEGEQTGKRAELSRGCLAALGEAVAGDRNVAVFRKMGGTGLFLHALRELGRRREVAVDVPARLLTAAAAAGVTLRGVAVSAIDAGGAASEAGVTVGMQLRRVADTPVSNHAAVAEAYTQAPGDTVRLGFEPPPHLFALPF